MSAVSEPQGRIPGSSKQQGGLGVKAGSFLAEPNRETFQAEPDEAREQGGWSGRLLAKHFGINNSNPLRSFADFMTCKVVSCPLFLLILNTGSTTAIIIPLVEERKTLRMTCPRTHS